MPTAPLLASRSSALSLVCNARAELKGTAELELLDELDELDDPDELAELPVPVDAAPVVEFEDVEAGVGEN